MPCTGMLNIDDLIATKDTIVGPIGFAALIFLLGCLLIELKPFPANGWGLDVYETAQSDVAALIAVGVTAGVFFALVKLLPLFSDQLAVVAALGAVTFVFSNLIGLQQDNTRRLLGYSSIGQMGLLTMRSRCCSNTTRQRPRSSLLPACSSITCSRRLGCSGLQVRWAGSACVIGRRSRDARSSF